MKIIIHILLLATIFLLPLSLSAQNKGFQIPSKEQQTTKSSGCKSSNSPKNNKQNSHSSNPAKSHIPEVIQRLIDNMVYVEGGTFTMGASSEQGNDALENEKPAHSVTLSSYYIGKYEITQAEWQVVMGNNPSHNKGSNLPVESVSWNDCQEFISKLNAMTGKHFRLPTEAEWEYVARGGNRSHGYKYAGSNTLDDVAWYFYNSGKSTHIVGTKSPNELCLYDMSGNVYEWVMDWYCKYSSKSKVNPTGLSIGSFHVYRGGSYSNKNTHCRIPFREKSFPSDFKMNLGLRLAL